MILSTFLPIGVRLSHFIVASVSFIYFRSPVFSPSLRLAVFLSLILSLPSLLSFSLSLLPLSFLPHSLFLPLTVSFPSSFSHCLSLFSSLPGSVSIPLASPALPLTILRNVRNNKYHIRNDCLCTICDLLNGRVYILLLISFTLRAVCFLLLSFSVLPEYVPVYHNSVCLHAITSSPPLLSANKVTGVDLMGYLSSPWHRKQLGRRIPHPPLVHSNLPVLLPHRKMHCPMLKLVSVEMAEKSELRRGRSLGAMQTIQTSKERKEKRQKIRRDRTPVSITERKKLLPENLLRHWKVHDCSLSIRSIKVRKQEERWREASKPLENQSQVNKKIY